MDLGERVADLRGHADQPSPGALVLIRLHGLLCFYDEPVESLVACLTGLKAAGVDHVVALDGAFALYPDGEAASHPNQHAAVHLACRQLGMACSLHVPSAPWAGNEPEKRTALFALAWALADEGDWFMVNDADMVVMRWPDDLKDRLERTDCEVAKVEILDVVALAANQPNWPATFEFCCLYRARKITVGPHHATYVAEDGRKLWAGHGDDPPVPVLDLTGEARIEHRPNERPAMRQLRKQGYYAARDESKVERGDCDCGRRAVKLASINWRWSEIGPVADWREVCDECAVRVESTARRQLIELGIDPDSVKPENRNGKPPAAIAVR